ncbi:MAG TPA: cysteine-rich outer membrane protein [Steroidobacteraceae bacterium]|nr:cysteine-rich outer membrane protein [Steroidobacteraceae bacterium]
MNVFWIPIIAIVFSLSFAMLGLWADHQRRSQKLEHAHRERMAAIEKGVPLPVIAEERDRADDKWSNPARMLRSGVLLLTLGIILYFAIHAAGGVEGALFGLIPSALGLANLAYAAVLFDREKKAAAQKENSSLPPL